jgi:hypothetical protein
MDSVTVNGKLYKKATVLAKQFRYTTDYIGQLCRQKKVDCQFVGRSWYVTEASLLAHKDARYKEVRIDEKTIKNNSISFVSKEATLVYPRLLKTTTRVAPKSHFTERLIPRESKYFADEADLVPLTTKRAERIKPEIPKVLPVLPAEAVAIKVVAKESKQNLEFTDIPSVSLTGSLKVKDIEPDNSPSVPVSVVVPPTPVTLSEPTTSQTIKPIPSGLNKVNPRAIIYRPTTVPTEVRVISPWFLYLCSLLASLALFFFVATAATHLTIRAHDVSSAVVLEFFETVDELLFQL